MSSEDQLPDICRLPDASAPDTSKSVPDKRAWPPELRIAQGWKADIRTVKLVLEAAGSELWTHFDQRMLEPLIVHSQGGPVTLYDRGPDNAYVVKLNTGGNYWAQYVFQFAHELCHVLIGIRPRDKDRTRTGNEWFEESVCEAASLFVLRRLAATWKRKPPYDHWREYANRFAEYASSRISRAQLERTESSEQTISTGAWYFRHESQLRASPLQRELNNVVAIALLDLFEAEPAHWNCVGFLPSAITACDTTLHDFLHLWKDSSPDHHRPFIEKITAIFDSD
ncbi:MAG: hypothetical protein AAF456_05390 [Planctomycetota bacterium]